jgi:ATP-dependent protease HslVU (ClpYQ) peptidase subunit
VTCVVGLVDRGKIYMGADSAGSTAQGRVTIRSDKKVFMVGEYMIGICGSYRMRDILQYHTSLPRYNPKLYTPLEFVNVELLQRFRDAFKSQGFSRVENNEEEFDGSFIIGFRKKIFEIECDYQVAEAFVPWVAIGSGGEIATASLASTRYIKGIGPIDRINLALQVAADGNAFVRGPFFVSTLVDPKKKKK